MSIPIKVPTTVTELLSNEEFRTAANFPNSLPIYSVGQIVRYDVVIEKMVIPEPIIGYGVVDGISYYEDFIQGIKQPGQWKYTVRVLVGQKKPSRDEVLEKNILELIS